MDPYYLNKKSSIEIIQKFIQKEIADKTWEYINPAALENLCKGLQI